MGGGGREATGKERQASKGSLFGSRQMLPGAAENGPQAAVPVRLWGIAAQKVERLANFGGYLLGRMGCQAGRRQFKSQRQPIHQLANVVNGRQCFGVRGKIGPNLSGTEQEKLDRRFGR